MKIKINQTEPKAPNIDPQKAKVINYLKSLIPDYKDSKEIIPDLIKNGYITKSLIHLKFRELESVTELKLDNKYRPNDLEFVFNKLKKIQKKDDRWRKNHPRATITLPLLNRLVKLRNKNLSKKRSLQRLKISNVPRKRMPEFETRRNIDWILLKEKAKLSYSLILDLYIRAKDSDITDLYLKAKDKKKAKEEARKIINNTCPAQSISPEAVRNAIIDMKIYVKKYAKYIITRWPDLDVKIKIVKNL